VRSPEQGYLIWAAPEHPVFVDQWSDLYEWSDFLGKFDWANLQSDPNIPSSEIQGESLPLNPQFPMLRVLPLLHKWKIVFRHKMEEDCQWVKPMEQMGEDIAK
jgi:hypothetical protein